MAIMEVCSECCGAQAKEGPVPVQGRRGMLCSRGLTETRRRRRDLQLSRLAVTMIIKIAMMIPRYLIHVWGKYNKKVMVNLFHLSPCGLCERLHTMAHSVFSGPSLELSGQWHVSVLIQAWLLLNHTRFRNLERQGVEHFFKN